jgi:hypothetical protein
MEVRNYNQPKRITHHAVPVVMVVFGLFAVLALAFSQLANLPDSLALNSLTARVVDVKPSANGLAKVEVRDASLTHNVNSANDTGRAAQLMIDFSR